MTKSKTPCPYCGKKEWRSFASVCFLVELDSYSDLESFSNNRALEHLEEEWVELKSGQLKDPGMGPRFKYCPKCEP